MAFAIGKNNNKDGSNEKIMSIMEKQTKVIIQCNNS